MPSILLLVLFALEVAVPTCQAARWVPSTAVVLPTDSHQLVRRLQEHADLSYSAYSNARTIHPISSGILSRSAFSAEDAESTTNTVHTGIKRLTAPSNRRSYATVQAYDGLNPDGKDVAILPRSKAGVHRKGGPHAKTGTNSAGILAMGGAAVAQTYEGANAVSTTDSVEMYQGDGKTTLSANHVTTPPSKVAHASKSGSFGSTSWPVGSLAMSGASNGNLLLAQADDAVALVQVERSSEKLDKRLEQDRFKAFAP